MRSGTPPSRPYPVTGSSGTTHWVVPSDNGRHLVPLPGFVTNGPLGVAVESGGVGLIGTGVPAGPGRVTLLVGVGACAGVALAAEQPARTSAAAIKGFRILRRL
jgi:hypothetical protein